MYDYNSEWAKEDAKHAIHNSFFNIRIKHRPYRDYEEIWLQVIADNEKEAIDKATRWAEDNRLNVDSVVPFATLR